jgi:excisionase family DNA binding protein
MIGSNVDSGDPAAIMMGLTAVCPSSLVSSPVGQGKECSMEPDPEELLTPSEVAAMFRVNPKTVTRWARAGRISYIKTLGGHRRFKASEIRRLLEEAEESADT